MSSKELRFEGRVAIVTGAGRERGMGEAHAKFLAARGAKVVVNDFAPNGASPALRVANEIEAAGGTAIANGDDVSSPDGGASIVAAALNQFGRVDIVINNAGIESSSSFPNTETLEDLTRHFGVHLAGAFNVTKAAWPHFVANSYGRVVNITSSALLGHTPGIGNVVGNVGVSYSSIKAGMFGLTKTLSNYGASNGIMVNTVAPAAATQMGPNNVTKLSSGDQVPLDPNLVSIGVAVLVHELCPATGELFGIGGGKVDRLYFAATNGYLDTELTPERLLENWNRVMELDGSWIPENCQAHVSRLRQDRAEFLQTQ